MHSDEATINGVSRRAFIAGTTSGVLGALTLGAAVTAHAQQAAVTPQPDAPAGRVFYRAISGEAVQMRGHRGDMIDAYLARPTAGTSRP
jgi:hypothetical protein